MRNLSSIGVPRIVGYSLLLMSLINWADILFPAQFLNPTWELQTVGALVESAPLLLFSLVLIFYGEGGYRNKIERLLLPILSRACLLMSLCFLLLVLVAATSTVRINRQIDAQTGNVFRNQMEQLDQLESQVAQSTDQDIEDILESQGLEIREDDQVTPKEQLLEYLADARIRAQNQNTDSRLRRKRSTAKSALKWSIGAIVSGVTLAYIWMLTKWARFLQKANFDNRKENILAKSE